MKRNNFSNLNYKYSLCQLFLKDLIMALSTPILKVRTRFGIKIVKSSQITHIIANNVNSLVFFADEEPLLTNHSLKWFERKLTANYFCRCHRSFLVNLLHVKFYCNGYFVMPVKPDIKISRQRKNIVLSRYYEIIEKKASN